MNGESQVNGASVNGHGQTQYPQTKLNKIRVYKHRGMFGADDMYSDLLPHMPALEAPQIQTGTRHYRALTVANTAI